MKRLILGFFIISPLIFTSCGPPAKKTINAEVDTTFEMTPPIATDIELKLPEKQIDGANVLITARLDSGQVKGKYHAIMVNDEKLILRDDGLEGDEKESDGIFSLALSEDTAQLSRELDSFRVVAIKAVRQKKNLFEWQNRSGVLINEKIVKAGEERFDLRRGFRIDPRLIFNFAPDPALKDHSLMITDLGVVEDPSRTFNPCTATGTANGAWTFGKLMGDMANTAVTGVSAEDFIKGWLESWLVDQTVNSDLVPKRDVRMFTSIIKPWVQKSNPAVPPASILLSNWKTFTLDLKFAPFKLLAIVNRIDLRGNSGYGISNAGEGRFVFGVLTPTCGALTGPGKFTVIFEYGVPIKSCGALKVYAQQWIDLKTQTPGTSSYNTALQAITDQFTAAGAGGLKPNGSSLNQIRTNELAIGNPWELREFNIDNGTHKLFETTVKQEPAKIFNRLASPTATAANLAILAGFVNTHQAAILNNTYKVTATSSGVAFLGGKGHTETPGHFWDGSTGAGPGFIINDNARQVFSLNTCSGCHGGEGKTSVGNLINQPPGISHNPFVHISPQSIGTRTTLSAFLTGDPSQPTGLFKVSDPAGRPTGSPTVREFNDLERRASDLESFVATACLKRVPGILVALSFKPVNMTH